MLWRDDGSPTFHLASVVDDIDFGITHVIRGSDHRAERGAARRAAPRARLEPPRGDPPRPRRRRRRARSCRSAPKGRPSRRCATPAIRPRRCARTSRSSACRGTTSTSISTASARSRSTCSAALDDEELAERVGVPVEAAPLLRGAHDLVEARALARARARPAEQREPVDTSPETLERFVELRSPLPEVLDKDEAKAVVRELKAVGGEPAGAAASR